MIKKKCSHAGCNTLIPFNQRYCDKHKHKQVRSHASKSSEFANQVHQSWKWRKLSRQYRTEHPFCEECLRENRSIPQLATSVDHIKPLFEGGKPYDTNNLQSLCSYHHAKKSHAERDRK